MRSLRIIALLVCKDMRILCRSKATLMVIFIPGIVLYTIFTNIFSGPAGGGVRPLRVAVIDEDQSVESRQLIGSLVATNLKVILTDNGEPDGRPLTVKQVKESIRRRRSYRVGLLIPKGYRESPTMLMRPELHKGVGIIYDELEPIEGQIAAGMIQMAAGRDVFTSMFNLGKGGKAATTAPDGESELMLVKVVRESIRSNGMKNEAKHTFLAGIVPMFLLFSAAGAARGLLEAMKSGETRRLLAAPISPAHMVLGALGNMLIIQMIQCYVMYVFAWLVFHVAIWEIAGGLFALTLCTAIATIGFGLFLGAVSKTPEQLDALGTMVILAMSAIGGSMVPRHVMPEWMQRFGLLTINGWSFDGFMSVIARDGFGELWKPCAVLLGVGIVCAGMGSVLLQRRQRG